MASAFISLLLGLESVVGKHLPPYDTRPAGNLGYHSLPSQVSHLSTNPNGKEQLGWLDVDSVGLNFKLGSADLYLGHVNHYITEAMFYRGAGIIYVGIVKINISKTYLS